MTNINKKRASWIAYSVVLMFAILMGCTSLQAIAPETVVESLQHPVRLQGVDGPLSVEKSQAIILGLNKEMKKGKGAGVILKRHLPLEDIIVGSPLYVGNDVRLLKDGPATFDAMLDAIEKAGDHINMETYILDDDEMGRRFTRALAEKQAQGVQVNLIYDSVGTLETPDEFFEELNNQGIRTLEFNPINPLEAKAGWELNQRDHRKLLIVDGKTAFLGGINISSVYSSSSSRPRAKSKQKNPEDMPWRDTHIQIKGPAVKELQGLFLDTWSKQNGSPLEERNYFPDLERQGDDIVRVIGSSPDDSHSKIHATLISVLSYAENSIYLTNAYFVPDAKLLEALKEAVRRGVDVKIILPSNTDSGLVFHAGRSHYDQLLVGGVKIYERRHALLHAKTALIDGIWSTIGSANLDWRSFHHNDEVNAVVVGPKFGEEMYALFEVDLAESKQITLEEWRKRSLLLRLKEMGARIWSYWL